MFPISFRNAKKGDILQFDTHVKKRKKIAIHIMAFFQKVYTNLMYTVLKEEEDMIQKQKSIQMEGLEAIQQVL